MTILKNVNGLDLLTLFLAGLAVAAELLGWTWIAIALALAAFGVAGLSVTRGRKKPVILKPQEPPVLNETDYNTGLFARDYVIFDIEATGMLPHKDELIRIGAKKICNGTIQHGLDFDQRAEEEIVAAGRAFHAFSQNTIIVAHNAALKMAFLRNKATRTGIEWNRPVLDLVLLSSILFGPDAPHDTDAICARLGINTAAAGRKLALAKARRSSVIFEAMLPYLHAQGFESLEDLEAACQEQAQQLNARC